jgi:hypothetical protein
VEKGIAGGRTIAVMQAVSPKILDGKKVWKQEIWTMYRVRHIRVKRKNNAVMQDGSEKPSVDVFLATQCRLTPKAMTIISAWRYPGVSSKNNPIPEDIFRELE